MTGATALTSARYEVDLEDFSRAAWELGWGDGLPCIAPTPDLVHTYLDATDRDPQETVAVLLPLRARCTVEKIAINAAMTGAPPASMPLLCTAIEAMADSDLCLAGLNATTASVVPALFVNGPIRDQLDIPYRHACLGGARSSAPSIGRALRLVMRHVAGQVAGVTSESVFGQPARVVGLVFGEWEERSPWAPLAQRRGVPGNALTAFGVMGTANIADMVAESTDHLLEVIGKSAAYMGANGFLASTAFSQVALVINPTWAEIIANDIPSVDDVTYQLWDQAALPIDWFPRANREAVEALGRVHSDGRVHLVASPDDVMVLVAGGPGSLHATMLHGFSASLAVTRAIGS
jgi:hypothetical protein